MTLLRSRRSRLVVIGAAIAAALVVFVLVWFQPQKLLTDVQVDEALPGATQGTVSGPSEGGGNGSGGTPSTKDGNAASGVEIIAGGEFRALAHSVSGRASLLEIDEGQRYLRLEEFMVENGPDLRVYLSAAPSRADPSSFSQDFLDLGALKGNVGDQNYRIPSGTDLNRFMSAVIWCRRFSVGFAVAPLG
jgi:electron transfer DM13